MGSNGASLQACWVGADGSGVSPWLALATVASTSALRVALAASWALAVRAGR
ncbi:hypothetical protein D3C76_602240 [compost metagenome]